VLLLTGAPGVGKTTVIAKTAVALNANNFKVGGMISREIRQSGTRVGFEILDLTTGKRGFLAHIDQKNGPRVGKYRVNLEDLDKVGAQAIVNALDTCDVIAIDEIGPMELHSETFKQATKKALESCKLVIVVVHWKTKDKLITEATNRNDAKTFNVTPENREGLEEKLVDEATAILKSKY